MSDTTIPIPSEVMQWLSFLGNEKRYSTHTLAAYQRDISLLTALYPDVALSDISHPQVRSAIARLHAQDYSPRSLARILSTWRSFYKWFCIQKHLKINPTVGVKTPKVPRSLPKALSADQAKTLLDTGLQLEGNDAIAARDQAMFELFYSSGLRLSELVSVDTQFHKTDSYESQGWINLAEHEITVVGKGKKTRLLPLGEKAVQAIKHWLSKRPLLVKPSTPVQDEFALFLGERGARITPRVVQIQLKKLGIKSNLPTNIHPHVLRHSFASHLLQSSQDLRAVQELLGHAKISTTQIYTKLDFQHLAQVYDQAHPRAKKKSTSSK
ncbi:tyrosine recombinase XerC [Pelistega europaea]|uniref:Tyrosine recombinase XerC n=1 Tax=Pelistega europaea TaxID=106147 RepID=A0A7Y4LB73_9BURK|nr:tyrosine recombinase XerC [Pelistega europaea]NOL49326.1 tyrosine recombinase XerC [Pelistega europaea]